MNSFQHIGQISGTFKAGEELINRMIESTDSNMSKSLFSGILHLGIESSVSSFVYVNDILFEIGKTGILEIRDNVPVISVKFKEDTYAIINFSFA